MTDLEYNPQRRANHLRPILPHAVCYGNSDFSLSLLVVGKALPLSHQRLSDYQKLHHPM